MTRGSPLTERPGGRLLGGIPAGAGHQLPRFRDWWARMPPATRCVSNHSAWQDSAADFDTKLARPAGIRQRGGPWAGASTSHACMSHAASLAEPKDVAWLLASYARDGLARVETGWRRRAVSGDLIAVRPGRIAGHEVRRPARARPSSAPPWCRPYSMACSRPGSLWARRSPARRPVRFQLARAPSGTCARRCCGPCSSSWLGPGATAAPGTWWRCWTGPPLRSIGWTGTPFLRQVRRGRGGSLLLRALPAGLRPRTAQASLGVWYTPSRGRPLHGGAGG